MKVSGRSFFATARNNFRPQIVAMLAFLEAQPTPEKISPKDIEPRKAAGLSATAIVDGLNVCFLLNTVNRLAIRRGGAGRRRLNSGPTREASPSPQRICELPAP